MFSTLLRKGYIIKISFYVWEAASWTGTVFYISFLQRPGFSRHTLFVLWEQCRHLGSVAVFDGQSSWFYGAVDEECPAMCGVQARAFMPCTICIL